MTTFRLRRIIGDRPTVLNQGDIVFRASRPIFGADYDFGLMGFTCIIMPGVYGRDGFIQRNFELDAEVVEWVDKRDAIATVINSMIGEGYDADDVQACDESDLLDMWQYRHAIGTREVD